MKRQKHQSDTQRWCVVATREGSRHESELD